MADLLTQKSVRMRTKRAILQAVPDVVPAPRGVETPSPHGDKWDTGPDVEGPISPARQAARVEDLPTTRRSQVAAMMLAAGTTPYVALMDTAVVLLASEVAFHAARPATYRVAVLTSLATALIGLRIVGEFRSRLHWSVFDTAPSLVPVGFVAGVSGNVVVRYLDDLNRSPLTWLVDGLMVSLALLLGRAVLVAGIHAIRRRRLVSYRTLILGAGDVGERLARVLGENPRYGLRPVGFLDSAEAVSMTLPVLGTPDQLRDTVRTERAQVVIVAFPQLAKDSSADLMHHLRACDDRTQIFWVPRLYQVHQRSASMDEVWGVPLIRAARNPLRAFSWRVKRGFDIAVSGLALLLLSPLLAVVALAVRRETGASVLFRQHRVSRGGAVFELLKFRSLTPADQVESETMWAIAGDQRLGPVGRFIRSWSIDELPQLFNVLRGDMSLVGPRPERPFFVDRFSSEYDVYRYRDRVPAGITGWAAVNGLRGDTSIEDRALFDNYYVQNWSLWFDVKILAMTTMAVLRRTGS